jgi:L-asparaginase
MKKVIILHTGGTISMEEDKITGSVKPGQKNPVHESIPSLKDIANVSSEEVFHLPSPHVTPMEMMKLKRIVEEKLLHYDGVVITHGTDTLEETAYLLDLSIQSDKPVVVTGAMRSSNEIGADGPYNLISSVKTAASESAIGKGILVVLNDEIHTAKNVTKTHTSNIATFQSPQYGPIGLVTKRGVLFHHSPQIRDRYPIDELHHHVILLKAYAGMDSSLLYAIQHTTVDGVVIEALGQGNLPPKMLEGLKSILKKNVPVVLVSRCFNGIVQDIYGYEGGGKQLKELGVIFSNGLNGQKARLKLMTALEVTKEHDKIQQMFLK